MRESFDLHSTIISYEILILNSFLDATHISLLFLSGLSKDSLNEENSESFPVWIATTKVNYEAHRRNLIFYNRIDRSQYLYRRSVSPDIQVLLNKSVTGIWTVPWSMANMIQKKILVKTEKDSNLFFKQEHLTYFWALTYFKYYFFFISITWWS